MPNYHLSILVVDDAKFSSIMIGRALSHAGYRNIRYASSSSEALALLEKEPASILLADWLMPEMDGLELTARVRQLDEATGNYTYVILLTGKEGDSVLTEAFDHGVDDFVSKSSMHEQLVPRVMAADRLSNTLQRFVLDNHRLAKRVARLEERNLIDDITGLGNTRYLRKKLADSIRQVDSRGGAVCYMIIGIPQLAELAHQHGQLFQIELQQSIARRLQQLVRPLDVLSRVDDQHFAMITLLDQLQECSPSSFRRLHEGLNLKAFRTSEGFITLKAGIGLVGLDAKSLPLEADQVIERARTLLPAAYASGRINASRLNGLY